MVIQIDSREKARAIEKILNEFERQKIKHFISKLPVGDYQSLDNARVVIDRKQSLTELCSNVGQGHVRFENELTLAKELGIKVIILCEHGGAIKEMSDVFDWKNPRLRTSPYAMSGERLYKALRKLQYRYDVDCVFCDKRSTGRYIIEILERGGVK